MIESRPDTEKRFILGDFYDGPQKQADVFYPGQIISRKEGGDYAVYEVQPDGKSIKRVK